MGDAPLAAANWAAHDNKSGAKANMRSRVNRAEGPATLMVPMGNCPAKPTGAAMALRPAVYVSSVKLKPCLRVSCKTLRNAFKL